MISSANLAMADDDEWIDDDPHAPLQIPEWCCASTFACGRSFDDMTYKEMYENIQELHINNGGNHLDVHARKSDRKGGDMELLPGSITFYCPHARDHGDQCGRKTPENESAERADRSHEEKRIYFKKENPCCFHFTIRRVKDAPLPLQLSKPKHGHQNYMKCEAKTNWVIDGPKQQQAEGRKLNHPVLVHRSHPRKTLHMGKVSDDIRKYILEQAKCNVAVPSNQFWDIGVFLINPGTGVCKKNFIMLYW